jgi:hypothetical protein
MAAKRKLASEPLAGMKKWALPTTKAILTSYQK